MIEQDYFKSHKNYAFDIICVIIIFYQTLLEKKNKPKKLESAVLKAAGMAFWCRY